MWAQVAITTFLHLFHLVWTYFTLSTYGVGLKAGSSFFLSLSPSSHENLVLTPLSLGRAARSVSRV